VTRQESIRDTRYRLISATAAISAVGGDADARAAAEREVTALVKAALGLP